jgi:hypothetical protein
MHKIALLEVLMSDEAILEKLGSVPIHYGTLRLLYKDYRSPADKISELAREGKLIRLKRGLYVVPPKISRRPMENELIANHLYGPSYVSLYWALQHYSLIPEAVYTVQSVTPKRRQTFNTPIGCFTYSFVPVNYYRIGIRQAAAAIEGNYLIASPEKALCDVLALTKKLQIRSRKEMREYLEENLRIDLDDIACFDTEIIRECEEAGQKRVSLKNLRELINEQRT